MPTATHTARSKRAVATGVQKSVDVTIGESDAVLASVPVTALRNATGLIPTATEAAGGFNLSVASHVFVAKAEVTDNETEVSACTAQIVLPKNYVAGSDITVRIPCALIKSGSPTNNGSTIDLVVYKQASGAVGSDLCATAAQTFAALDTWYDKDFVVTGAGLNPGDTLNLEITSSVIDSEAGAGTIILNMDALKVIGPVLG